MDGKDLEMNDKDFEALKLSITQKMLELSCLQELYTKETGRCYTPATELRQNIRRFFGATCRVDTKMVDI